MIARQQTKTAERKRPRPNETSRRMLWVLCCVLVFTSSLIQHTDAQANYQDPFPEGRLLRCPNGFTVTAGTNSGQCDNRNSRVCNQDIDVCPGDQIHLSQCWGGTSTADGDAVTRLCIKDTGTSLGYDDDACGERRGGFFTYTHGGSNCITANIVDGCFGDKVCSGYTNFKFFNRVKRCGYGYYRSGSTCLPVAPGK